MFAIPRISTRFARLIPLSAGAFLGTSALFYPRRLILNEAPKPNESLAKYAQPLSGHGKSHFDGKLDYDQLTFGSFIGMVSGYFFGRISKILVGAIVTSLMATEYLGAAGYVDLTPFYSAVYRLFRKHFNQEVLVDDPSFKYSFSLAFLISAYNA